MTSTRGRKRDHLWVIGIIAGSAAVEVLVSWLGLGSVAGFPHLDLFGLASIPTSWTLAVGLEAYAGYGLWVWLAGAPGPRSRSFAMWSSIAAITLSLIAQAAYHVMLDSGSRHVPAWLAAFAGVLPVVVLGLAAFLAHLMHADRAAAEAAAKAGADAERKAERERTENDERNLLRAELAAAREAHEAALTAHQEALEAEQRARETAQQETAEALTRAEQLERKLAAVSDQQKAGKSRAGTPASAQAEDLSTELRALMELKDDPDLCKERMGGELARRLGVSAATGRRLHGRLTDGGRLSEFAESLATE